MFKRVERKRKRREEEEELGLDKDTKQIMGLNDTDSDESDSGSEQESAPSESKGSELYIGEDMDGEAEIAVSEDEGVNEEPPISVEEALKDPIYLISLDPTVHGCVLCKGKLIKNAGMTTAHKNANVHKRRFECFRLLSADTDPSSNAWELVRAIRSASKLHRVESQEPSKRALKRHAKQAAIREKRKRHKELKAKAIAKKASKKLSSTEETKTSLRCSPKSQSPSGNIRKKQKLESKTSTSRSRDVSAKSASRTKISSGNKKLVVKSSIKAKAS
ncbi:hypothetical protein L210DRAFT_3645541 [Boletus edulis BED1]|uniref:Uncharacterized protein n=1 Tax=Boletus edulis BED1 TaxID=1328754 RepID=A0AAD4GF77_BOLED|nr:hypothetical protein L210DRAFT_3645541 [Boletus edulis BED1]